MAHQPVGNAVSINVTNSSTSCPAQAQKTNSLRIVAIGTDAHVAAGGTATASASSYCVPVGTSAVLNLGAVRSQRIVAITTAAGSTPGLSDAILRIPDGQGTQFGKDQVVSLTSDQTAYNFTHKVVEDVTQSLPPADGIYASQIRIADAYSAGIGATFAEWQHNTELRLSFTVAAHRGAGAFNGKVIVQQVQVSGDA